MLSSSPDAYRPAEPALAFIAALAAVLSIAGWNASAAAQVCGTGGSCVEPHTEPGCDDPDCCLTVCLTDPTCCTQSWDVNCALLANELCAGLCGAQASGPCNQPNGTPACANEACCNSVCAADPFCCDTQWDFSCAALAGFICSGGGPGTCGDPSAGPCTEPHDFGACDDEGCCEVVCQLDPSCCSQAWDLLCVALAEEVCVKGCVLDCPPDAHSESEPCGARINDPCLGEGPGQAAELLECGEEICGRLFIDADAGFDSDAYAVTIPFTGGSTTRVQWTFATEAPAFLALLSGGCDDLASAVVLMEGDLCAPLIETVCLPPGSYLALVAPGTPDAIGGDPRSCDFGEYRLGLDCLEGCDDPCGTAKGECGIAHQDPGCADQQCCAAVCGVDPVCCVEGWDSLCVKLAVGLCGLEPPANDLCADAIDVGLGTWPFSTTAATTDGPELPESCDEGFGLSMNKDVWFRYDCGCDGLLRVETCGSVGFDSRIAIYTGGCKAPILVACNDDAEFCAPTGSSRVLFSAVCGESYLIRVGGYLSASGDGELTLECLSKPCPVPCPGDLDGSGTVDGADLTTLLAAWGTADANADLDGNGSVDGADLTTLLAAWGSCP